MTAVLSIYLDALRFLAAIAVLWNHLSGQRFTGGLLWQLASFGHDAVLFFFILSGFVIGYVSTTKETTPRDYALSRLARMYSVVVPALVTTAVADAVSRSFGHAAIVFDAEAWRGYAQSLLFVNQLWSEDWVPGTNLPFWSLGYEVPYYILFGVFQFVPGRARWPLLFGLMAIAGPKIMLLFPVWIAGLLTFKACAGWRLRPGHGAVLAVGSVLVAVALEVGAGPTPHANGENYGLDYALALALCVHIVGFRAAMGSWVPASWVVRVVRFLANRTFSLYLYHLPIASALIAVIPWSPLSLAGRLAAVGGTLGGCFLLAQWTELKKQPWRAFFAKLYPPT